MSGKSELVSIERFLPLAEKYGTPLFVYDENAIVNNVASIKNTVGNNANIFYSVKANPNPAIIKLFYQLGCSIEVASKGELELGLHCGVNPRNILFAGPGKTEEELTLAVRSGILAVNAESLHEILMLESICRAEDKDMDICLRVNLNLGQFPHKRDLHWFGINQFGIEEESLPEIIDKLKSLKRVRCIGLHLHMASGVLDSKILAEFIDWQVDQAIRIGRMLDIKVINLGGGWGQRAYADDPELELDTLRSAFCGIENKLGGLSRKISLFIESGRFLIGPAGYYLSRVVTTKSCRQKDFVILDGGINHCLFLSNAFRSMNRPVPVLYSNTEQTLKKFEITGSLCTPIDRLASDVLLPDTVKEGDLLVFPNSGAYTKMASPLNFLGHSWPQEVLIGSESDRLIAKSVSMLDIVNLFHI
jgi:diaminopimelate decarboxylase